MRLGGWVFVAAGVGMIACAFVTPFLRALEVDLAITAAVVVIWTAIH